MNELFKSASLKLTGWYLLIIMLICISFSTVIYQVSSNELMRRLPPRTFVTTNGYFIDSSALDDVRDRLAAEGRASLVRNLFLANVAALAIGGGVSYWLARRTLQPISEAHEVQTRFISDASHELRTPLTAMHAENEIALRDPDLTKTQMRDLLKSNLEEVDKLQSLSERLLQLTNGKDIPMSEVQMDDMAIEAMNRTLIAAQAKDIAIENNVGRAKLRGNAESLTDLLTILLDNAVKYSPEKSQIVMSSKIDGRYAQIDIRDHGIGIKASDLPHIFDRFYRADPSRNKQQIAGYGLGLSIAKKIVDLHDGTIDAASTPGKGTTFKVRIPLS